MVSKGDFWEVYLVQSVEGVQSVPLRVTLGEGFLGCIVPHVS